MNNKEIKKLQEKINDMDWDFDDSISSPINKIHPYPAKFIEQIPDQLLDIFNIPKDTIVFDPFIGSGTTAVSAMRHGNNFLGVDLNPIAILLSSVKTNPLPLNYLEIVDEVVSKALDKYDSEDYYLVNVSNAEHWFSKPVHAMLSCLIQSIKEKINLEKNSKNALEIALSSIVVKVSFQESDTRYAAKPNNYDSDTVLKYFYSANKQILSALIDEEGKNNIANFESSELILGSSLEIDLSRYQNKIGAIITSPPYPNSYEYWLYHKFRMEFLGYNPKEVKKKEIGTRSRYFKKNPETIEVFRTQMKNLLEKSIDLLVSKGFIAIVIGTSMIHGELFDNGEDIKRLGIDLGLEFITKISRKINLTKKSFNVKNSRLNTEDIIIFRKGEKKIHGI